MGFFGCNKIEKAQSKSNLTNSYQDENEKCLICGCMTRYKRNVPIDNRAFYVKGCGQLCEICYCDIYKW